MPADAGCRVEGVPRGRVKPGGGLPEADGEEEEEEEEGRGGSGLGMSKPEVRGTGFAEPGDKKAPRPLPFAVGLFRL